MRGRMKSTGARPQNAVSEMGEDAATRAAFSQAADVLRLHGLVLEGSNPDTARRLYSEARSLYHQVGDVGGEAHCVMGLAGIALACGDFSLSAREYDDALALFRKTGSVESAGGPPWQYLCIQGRRLSIHLRQNGKEDLLSDHVSAEVIDFLALGKNA